MGSPLTQAATPAELADRQQVVETKETILCFPRLAEIVQAELEADPDGAWATKWRQFPVQINIRFDWADSRREFVSLTGSARAQVGAICQRCLQPFEFELRVALKLLLLPPDCVTGAEADYEIWELDDEWLRPVDIVDEVLIMAMPFAARHEDDKDCTVMTLEAPAERSDTVRPFADLRSQMQD